jgi:hypothetical protein
MARPPHKTLLVLLAMPVGGKRIAYSALLLGPDNQSPYIEGGGPMELKGKFEDKGYKFTRLRAEVPNWVIAKIPSRYNILYIADVIGFPMAEAV